MNHRSTAFAGLFALMLAGCGSGGGGVSQGTPPTQASPLTLSAPSLSINAVGATAPLTVSESGYSGTFSVTLGLCATFVTIDSTSHAGPQGTFTFTGTATGSCAASITDAGGQKQPLTITVTSTTGTLQ